MFRWWDVLFSPNTECSIKIFVYTKEKWWEEQRLQLCLSVSYITSQSTGFISSRRLQLPSGVEPVKPEAAAASVSRSSTSTPRMIVQLNAPLTLPTQPFITNFSNQTHPTLICRALRRGERRREGSVRRRGLQAPLSSSADAGSSGVEANARSVWLLGAGETSVFRFGFLIRLKWRESGVRRNTHCALW